MNQHPNEHSPSGAPLEPISPSARSPVLDALRGFAVLGIFAMNIPGFSHVESDFWDPRIVGFEGTDRAVWLFNRLMFDMKMQSIFSMLFGAGLVVLGERAAASGRSLAGLHYRRMIALALLGILHAYLIWFGDILWTYAVCGALIYPLRRLPNEWLLTIGAGLFLFGALTTSGTGVAMWFLRDQAEQARLLLDSGGTPSSFQQEMLAEWKELTENFRPGPEKQAEEAAAMLGGYTGYIRHRAPSALEFQVGVPFWVFSLWRFAGYMLIGVACMRLGVFTGRLTDRAYALMALAGYGLGIPITCLGALDAMNSGFDFVRTFITAWQLNYIASAFIAFGHIGALMLLFRSPVTGRIVEPLAAVGRLALTNYLSQSIIAGALFCGWGLGWWNSLTRAETVLVVIAIWMLQIIWSILWLRRFRLGPFEWLWRWLTYGTPPRMRL